MRKKDEARNNKIIMRPGAIGRKKSQHEITKRKKIRDIDNESLEVSF